MRVSKLFDLDRKQSALDFVDVDVDTDSPVFIDPRAIRIQKSSLAAECEMLLVSFFGEVLESVRAGDDRRTMNLLDELGEPNETHFGLSRRKSRGRGLGRAGAGLLSQSFARSTAAKTGLLADLEDAVLFIKGIGADIISDVTTHIIRSVLITYTRQWCELYGIPLEEQHSGPIWDADELNWTEQHEPLPRARGDKLLLVPKSIVRVKTIFDGGRYFSGYLAPHLETLEKNAGSELVSILKNGQQRVDRRRLREKYGDNKEALALHTQRFPEALLEYKDSITLESYPPSRRLAGMDRPDFGALLANVKAVKPGTVGATAFHRAAAELLTALFYPHLTNMRPEEKIHAGRKRIDIVFDNLANVGTFRFLQNYKAPTVVVECKNYAGDPKNPELDQISGRFSPHRTHVGILICRGFANKKLFVQRCRDTALDHRGYVIPVDDEDLERLVADRKTGHAMHDGNFPLLRERFNQLVN